MKILVLTGSPRSGGNSVFLAENFIRGAEEAGHDVAVFHTAKKRIHPCTACEHCHTSTDMKCGFDDDMKELNPLLLRADAVVFATPVYYYGITAQLAAAINRFYANDELLKGDKKSALLLTYADDSDATADGPVRTYQNMLKYLEWEDGGMVIAKGCQEKDAVSKTDYPMMAYRLGADF